MDWQFPPFPFGIEVRTSTLIFSAIVLGGVAWRTRSPLRGFVALAAWISAYEVLYSWTEVLLGRWGILNALSICALLGWVVLALWMGHRPSWPWLVVFIVLWMIWIALGFHANVHGGRPSFSLLQEVMNVATKSALAIAYLVGSPGIQKQHVEEVIDRDGGRVPVG